MLSLRRGRVTQILERAEGLVRLEVEGRPCIAYPRLTGPVSLGDDVVVNVQALDLGLGSGGFDILYVNLTRGLRRQGEEGAHVMKLPYTPLQHAVHHVEEDAQDEADVRLGGMPVLCCSLHSQVAAVCAGLGGDLAAAYIQLPGGALPVSLSDAVRGLRRRGLLQVTVAVGACVDGDVACVSTASALAWAARAGMRAVVCAIGPGVAGTRTRFGHGGTAAAEAANAACALGGRAIIVPRVSEADPRERHRGLSHHTRAVVDLALGPIAVPWPADLPLPDVPFGLEPVDVTGWQDACAGLPLAHMGRGPAEDPTFFAAAFAAGRLARTLVG